MKGKHIHVLQSNLFALQPECDEDPMQSDWHNIARESMVGFGRTEKLQKSHTLPNE